MKQTIKINDDATVSVELSNGGRYTMREPLAKDMEGLGQDLIKIKHTDSVQKLLAKISTPPLTRIQYGQLTLSDAQVLNAAIDFFSAPPSAKAEMQAAMQELGYSPDSNTEPTPSSDIFQTAAEAGGKSYRLIDDCIAQCAASFGSLERFEQCNAAELLDWTDRAVRIGTPE